jgi:hypothetical protein
MVLTSEEIESYPNGKRKLYEFLTKGSVNIVYSQVSALESEVHRYQGGGFARLWPKKGYFASPYPWGTKMWT